MSVHRYKLEVDYAYDFILVGISSHEKPHRVAWALNNSLELDLSRTEPFSLSLKKSEPNSEFVRFSWEHPDFEATYSLLSNKGTHGLLIPEQHQADYFLLAQGPFTTEDEQNMIAGLRTVPFILMAYRIDPDQLKSKQNLIF
ncbi:MAG TPA: IPExxxVDY family protein [Bacteroidia bacterium]|nr:IPExxxVDY family protein [Bacteroidia bacterium]